jgi:cysteine synthase
MNAGKSEKAEKPAEKKTETKAESPGKAVKRPLRSHGKVYNSVLDTVGGTPMVRLPRLTKKYGLEADILAKLEFFNPLSSTKERVALAMIEEAESAGKIAPGKTTLIEATAGNFAHALAFVAAVKGYKLILVMPEITSFERRKILLHLGAELVLTPGNNGMKGAVEKAKTLIEAAKDPVHTFNQFENKGGIHAHAETTAEEIWADTEGKIDILVTGVGSGATIMGLTTALKKKKPGLKSYAVEPEEASVLSGMKVPAQHDIQGIGAGFVPSILDIKIIDGIIKVPSAKSLEIAREMAAIEGIPGGISAGASLLAAMQVAKMPDSKGKTIVMLVQSSAERYLSSPLFAKI